MKDIKNMKNNITINSDAFLKALEDPRLYQIMLAAGAINHTDNNTSTSSSNQQHSNSYTSLASELSTNTSYEINYSNDYNYSNTTTTTNPFTMGYLGSKNSFIEDDEYDIHRTNYNINEEEKESNEEEKESNEDNINDVIIEEEDDDFDAYSDHWEDLEGMEEKYLEREENDVEFEIDTHTQKFHQQDNDRSVTPTNYENNTNKECENCTIDPLNMFTPTNFKANSYSPEHTPIHPIVRPSPSSTSSHTTITSVISNNSNVNFVKISNHKSNRNSISTFFSSDRLKTHFGKKQEDHMVSYELFLRFFKEKAKNKKLIDLPKIIYSAFLPIICEIPNPQDTIDYISKQEDIKKQLSHDPSLNLDAYKGFINRDDIKGIARQKQIEVIQDYISSVALKFSTNENITHLKTHSKQKDEGVQISSAIASLSLLNEFIRLRDIHDLDINKKVNFTKQCLSVGGKFTRGMRKVYFHKNASSNTQENNLKTIRAHFGLSPNIDHTDPDFNANLANDLFRLLNSKYDAELIASLIEDCFDFPRQQYPKEGNNGEKLSISASKRSELQLLEKDKLLIPSTICLFITLCAFPNIDINIEHITQDFLRKTSKNQGWGLLKQDIETLKTGICNEIRSFKNMEKEVLAGSVSNSVDSTYLGKDIDQKKIDRKANINNTSFTNKRKNSATCNENSDLTNTSINTTSSKRNKTRRDSTFNNINEEDNIHNNSEQSTDSNSNVNTEKQDTRRRSPRFSIAQDRQSNIHTR